MFLDVLADAGDIDRLEREGLAHLLGLDLGWGEGADQFEGDGLTHGLHRGGFAGLRGLAGHEVIFLAAREAAGPVPAFPPRVRFAEAGQVGRGNP